MSPGPDPTRYPTPTRVEKRTFGVMLTLAAIGFLWTVSPIWVPVFLGVMLAVVASPLQRRLLRRFPRHPRLLAAAISFLTVALSIGIVAFLGYFVVRELLHYLTDTAPKHAALFERWLHTPHIARMLNRLGQTPNGVMKQAESYSHSAVTHLTDVVGGVLSATSHVALVIIFTTITSYYLLVEGPALARFGVRMVPLPPRETRALMHEFHEVAVGTLLGIGVIAVVQGTLAGLGYWACGVSKPVVWAALTAGASLLPAIGTGLICVPVAVAQILTGHVTAGVALLVYWQTVVVLIPDYKLRPWLMKGHMRLHELLVLISVFGGIEAFGAVGLLIGPMLVAMFVAMLRIYERDYKPAQPEPPAGPPPSKRDRDRDKDKEDGPRLHGRHPQPV